MQNLEIDLPGQRYPIRIGAGILAAHLPAMVGDLARELVVVVTNDTLARLYPDKIEAALAKLPVKVATISIPDGEQYKTFDTLVGIYDKLMEFEANRHTVLIAFGGGVVGDIAGLAAATFMRGIPLVQVPTTLLAQVDSSIGGKTAVNHPRGKNAVGVFKQPKGVLADLEFLSTLPPRELRAGLFELIKHAIIADRDLYQYLEDRSDRFASRDWDFWESAISRSCRVKTRVVEQDEQEGGLRAVLNFGHTLGHLIETHTQYSSYLHGEAVGVGMLFAAFASREWGILPDEGFQRIRRLLQPLIAPVTLPPLDDDIFTRLLLHDKKSSAGALRFIALRGLGDVFIREGTTPAELWPLFERFTGAMPEVCRIAPVF